MSEEQNILPQGDDGSKGKLLEEKLMAYLDGRLAPGEQHDVEQWLADEGMESDAVEGLRTLGAGEAKHSVNKLNHSLRKSLYKKRRKRKPVLTEQLAWIAVVIVLLLAVVAYIAIRKSAR